MDFSKVYEPEVVYVLDKYEQSIAVFKKDDKETLINPRIAEFQNKEAEFTFSISSKNPKWEQIKNPENLYRINDKVFSTNFEDCFEESVTENDESLIIVKAYEREKLLSRKYVRAWNSTTGFENIDTFMVVILSGGNLDLVNNGELVESSHIKGTSGYALDALLYGTGWTTGICDVEGFFDLETDQIDIYENILKIQEIWGGILVFDSLNKIVHHRDETKFLPYNGYEVKYKKNMQSLNSMHNNKIITKLCPLGEAGLNIKTVNNDSEWLINNSYTDSVLEGIINNPDIVDTSQLKRWGERKLKDLCKPTKELTVDIVLLNKVKGYELETLELNDIVDVIDYEYTGINEQLRVVNYEYAIWDNVDATVVLSDVTLESTDIFKKNVQATNIINAGTLNSKQVIVYHKNGDSIEQVINNVDVIIENTKSELTKSDEAIGVRITKTEDGINTLNNEIVATNKTVEELNVSIEGLRNTLTSKGGNNLVHYSLDFWENTGLEQYTGTEIIENSESGLGYILNNGVGNHLVNQGLNKNGQLKNGYYTLSFIYKKILPLAECKVKINDDEYVLDSTNWVKFVKTFEVKNNRIQLQFTSNTNASCYLADILINIGTEVDRWTQNPNETITDDVLIGKGITVKNSNQNTYTKIDADGTRIFNSKTDLVTSEFTEKGTETEELIVRGQAEISGMLVQQIGNQTWISSLL